MKTCQWGQRKDDRFKICFGVWGTSQWFWCIEVEGIGAVKDNT